MWHTASMNMRKEMFAVIFIGVLVLGVVIGVALKNIGTVGSGGDMFLAIPEFNSKKPFSSFSSPNHLKNCLSARSQCNTCSRTHVRQPFICTRVFCEDEKFICVSERFSGESSRDEVVRRLDLMRERRREIEGRLNELRAADLLESQKGGERMKGQYEQDKEKIDEPQDDVLQRKIELERQLVNIIKSEMEVKNQLDYLRKNGSLSE